MKYVIDTCGWIEKITGGPFNNSFSKHFKNAQEIIVPTIVQSELFKWVSCEKDEETAWSVISVTEQCHVLPLDTAVALLAAELSLQFQLAMADAFIYAFSRKHKAMLVTCDSHFAGLGNVIYFEK